MTRRRKWWCILEVFAGALLASQEGAVQTLSPATGWTKYENLAPVTGADGNPHSATCSGFPVPGQDPSFSFWAKRGTSKNLVVYFDGGGACFDDLTCTFPVAAGLPPEVPQFFVPAIAPTTDPANYDGIFKADDANPVKDWSFVYIPYCTGDLHIGSATKQYLNAGNPVLPPTFTIEHRGFDNFMVVLDWIKKNVDAPKSILVAGSSAGGYGASANFPWIQETYPDAHMYVIADASQGVTTDAFDKGTPGRNSWNPKLAPWVFGNNPSLLVGADLLRTAAEAYPNAKVSQFTTNFDSVQIPFYGIMKQYYGPGGSCSNLAVDWNQQMLGTLNDYATEVDNFRFYLAGGTYHTIMSSPNFYTESSPGITYGRWVDAMLQNRGGTGGSGGGDWQDAACETCLGELTCP
jgi:Pectinacetylesterase